ncbi:MAG: alginate export family protein, partial [Candidatus Omnitrophica bacterium]|nr:alginate export family protein [Candidatus Omnitrophota bacterium]
AVPAGGGGAGSAVNRSEGDDFFMSITQVEVAADLTDNVSTVINLINQRDWNADTFGTGASMTSNEFDILLDLAYVQMKEIFYAPLTLTVGRQDLLFGRGFIIGWNPQDPQGTIQADEFTQIWSFDAVRATLDFNPWTIDFVYSKINENSHDPEDDRDLYITNVNYKFSEYNAVAEGYFITELDRATTAGSTGTRDNDTYTVGGRVQFDPISQITLGGELAYQFGDYYASASAPSRDREAWAADIFGEYRWDYEWKPMVGIQYVLLSGEEDLSGTSTQSYGAWNGAFRGPTYGWIHEYLETYYATGQSNDQPTSQNHQHISVYGSIKPMEDLLLSAYYYYLWTHERIHSTPTDISSSSEDDELGHEVDILLTYNYTEDVTFNFMADWFIPGDFYNSPNDSTASQFITEVKVTF